MIMILAFNFCQRYRTSPLLVYALTRITFSLDLLLGFGGFNVYRSAQARRRPRRRGRRSDR